jgi:alkylation response protein AidB-like acyl-CoA dehydrogenase
MTTTDAAAMNETDAAAARADRAETTRMLRESVQAFVRERGGGRPSRDARDKEPGYDAALVAEMADLGWFGLLASEDVGGAGLGFSQMSAVLEELSEQLMAEPISAAVVLAGRVIERCNPSDLRAKLLTELITGVGLPALAWQEQAGNRDVGTIETRLTHASNGSRGYTLDGRKAFVAGAGAASGYLTSCKLDGDIALVWVPIDASHMEQQVTWRADGAPSVALGFQATPVSADALLARGTAAESAISAAITEATVMVCAELVSLSRFVLAMTVEYLGVREQYGRKIGSFQALQHRTVDLFVQKELSAAVLEEAIDALDLYVEKKAMPDLEMQQIASRAKARCSDAALRITREAIQLHGAIGYTDEHDLGLYLKRALVLSAWLGNAADHRAQFARRRMAS